MKIDKLIPYHKNAKKHPTKQVQQIANSIKAFGFNQPIVIDKNNVVIVGHGRLEAAKLLELDDVPVIQVNLTDEQANAYRLADNKLNESEWDMTLVIEDLKGLSAENFNLTGFDADLILEPLEKDDEVPELPNEPRSKLGDLYKLGVHTLICADCTQPDAVLKLMGDVTADISFTSPPYNVGHNLGYEGKDSKYVHSDDKVDYQDLIVKSTQNSLENAKDVFVNLQFLAGNKKQLLLWLAELADNFKDIFFWKKSHVAPAMAENVANSQVEVIVLFGRDNNTRSWGNKKWRGNFSNSIETKSASGENKNAKIHNATYPVELPLTFLKQSYNHGSNVLDLFAGTGTTMIACEKMGMNCFMCELEPLYCDVIVQRYVDYVDEPKVILNNVDVTNLWTKTVKKP